SKLALHSTHAGHPLAASQVEMVFMSSCYPRRDDISTSFTFHVAPLGNGTYSETRLFADDSKHFATHLNAPVPSCSKRLIASYFLQLQVDYPKIYGISIPLLLFATSFSIMFMNYDR
ncbi:hypothetical protein ALC60_10783, partial [Trachymyrmex zeteki]